MSVILCIESDEAQQVVLGEFLASHGFTVVTARDGLEGVKKARLLRPDMILIDLELPHMDGLAVIGQLKIYTSTRDIPIIFTSALPADYAQQLVQETGVQGFVVRPYLLRELLKLIQNNLPRTQNRSRLAQSR